MLKVAQVAEHLNCSVSTVYSLIESGRLAHHRLGTRKGAIRVSEADLETYLLECHEKRAADHSSPPPRKPPITLKHIRL